MEKSEYVDIVAVISDEKLIKLGASFFLFGSFLHENASRKKNSDIDIAIEIPPESKSKAINQLCKIARNSNRKSNWTIDVYSTNSVTFGYNGRSKSPLHFLIIDQNELASNSVFSNSLKKYFKRLTSKNLDEIKNGRV